MVAFGERETEKMDTYSFAETKNMSLFAKSEGKEPVDIDEKNIEKMGIHLNEEKLFTVEEGYIRHDSLKTAFLMFAYLMENEQQK
mgnify:CR=1 FL=1